MSQCNASPAQSSLAPQGLTGNPTDSNEFQLNFSGHQNSSGAPSELRVQSTGRSGSSVRESSARFSLQSGYEMELVLCDLIIMAFNYSSLQLSPEVSVSP